MKTLEGKVALVTGSGRGIGEVIARRLAKEGATIVAHYSGSREGAEQVVRDIYAQGGTAFAYQADIGQRPEVKRMFEEIDAEPGALDIVVNNSGVMTAGALADITDEQIELIFGVNVFGPLYVASEAAKRLRHGGRIINFSSSVAKYPVAGAGLYSAAKKAVESFTESWARELGTHNITVNTIVPGATSPGMMDASPEYREFMENASPFRRIGRADEIASIVAFLASNEGSWISGAHIMANGAANT